MNCSGETGFPDVLGGSYFLVVHGAIDVAIVTVIVSCNVLVIVAIVKYHRQRKNQDLSLPPNSASIRLVLSLALSDILAGLTTVYYLLFDYSCAVYTTLGVHEMTCVARFALFMFASTTSCFLLVALTIDRYVAVVHPLRYREIMTIRVANLLIVLMFVLGAINGFSLFFWNNWSPSTPCRELYIVPIYYITFICMSNFIVVSTVLLGLHCSIHWEALASKKFARSMSCGILPPSLGNPMKARSARNIYLVLVCVVLLWTPLTAIVIAKCGGMQSKYLDMAEQLAISIFSLGYFVNTFIYSWKNTTIKAAVLQMFGRVEQRRESSDSGLRII